MVKVNKVKLSLCLTNQALHHEGEWGSACMDPRILDLDTSWEVNGQLHDPAVFLPEKEPPVPIG
jgi:hypothetical protein